MDSTKILLEFDRLATEGWNYIKEYVKSKGGYLAIDSKGKDKMYAIVYHVPQGNTEYEVTALKVEDDELGICVGDHNDEDMWWWDEIYWLPTVQSILEVIKQY